MSLLAVEGVVLLAALLLAGGVALLAADWRRAVRGRQIRRRLAPAPPKGGDGSAAGLRKRRNGLGLHRRLMAAAPYRRFDALLGQAGLAVPGWIVLAGLPLATGLLWVAARGFGHWGAAQAGIAATMLGLVLPLAAIRGRARRRERQLTAQLVEAIDIMVRSLRAGHPVTAAMGLVARELPDPAGGEFGLAFDEMSFGLDLRDALENLARRVHSAELHYLVVALRVQHGTGGNLAEMLASLARVLRERAALRDKMRAWTAEGRLSAGILAILPAAVALLINLINPSYYHAVADDPLFLPVMAGAVGEILLAVLVLRRIVRIAV